MPALSVEHITCDSPPERWLKLQEFARSFDHEVYANFAYTVFKHDHADVFVGYEAVLLAPVKILAVHPAAEHRDMLEVLRMSEGHSKIQYGECYCAAPEDSPLYPYLQKRGFKNLGLNLHRSA